MGSPRQAPRLPQAYYDVDVTGAHVEIGGDPGPPPRGSPLTPNEASHAPAYTALAIRSSFSAVPFLVESPSA